MEASLKIGNDIIQPIIEAKIHSAIIEAMGGQANLVTNCVLAVLSTHRDRDGKVCSKGAYGDAGTFLESISRKYIEAATHKAIEQYFSEHQAEVTEALKKELVKQKNALASAFFDGLKKSATSAYTTAIRVEITPRKNS